MALGWHNLVWFAITKKVKGFFITLSLSLNRRFTGSPKLFFVHQRRVVKGDHPHAFLQELLNAAKQIN